MKNPCAHDVVLSDFPLGLGGFRGIANCACVRALWDTVSRTTTTFLPALCPRHSGEPIVKVPFASRERRVGAGDGRRPKCTNEAASPPLCLHAGTKTTGEGGGVGVGGGTGMCVCVCGGGMRWWACSWEGIVHSLQLQNGRYSLRAAMCCDSQGHCGAKVKALRAHGRGAGDS